MSVVIGVDPHKASHTAVAVDEHELPLGNLRVRSSAVQLDRLLEWATPWPQRTWAVENASGLGYLMAQQNIAAGERVVDVQPNLAARVRLLGAVAVNKNDPNDAAPTTSRSSGCGSGAAVNSATTAPGSSTSCTRSSAS